MKKFVLKNNQGFTLLEGIIGLLCYSIIAILLLILILVMNKNNINNYEKNHISMINNQIENDLLASKKIIKNGNKLEFYNYNDENKIDYSCGINSFSRKKHNAGTNKLISGISFCKIIEQEKQYYLQFYYNDKKYKIYLCNSTQ